MESRKNLIRALFGTRGRTSLSPEMSSCRRRNKAQENRVAEQLEKRLALTNNFYEPVFVAEEWDGTPEENWASIYSDGGSDIYVRHAPTIDRALFLAENGGFAGEVNITGFNTPGASRTNLIATEGTDETTINVPQVNGPYYNGVANQLLFPLPHTIVDASSLTTGQLTLADGRIFDITNQNPVTGVIGGLTFSATGAGGSGNLQGFFAGTGATAYGRGLVLEGPLLGGLAGNTGSNTLRLNYDVNNSFSGVTNLETRVSVEVRSAASDQLTTAYQVIDPTPDPVTGLAPVYAPGTLRGTIDVDVMDAQQTIPYQVNQSTPDADGLIPISFSTGSSATLQNDLAFDRPFRSPYAYVKIPYFTNLAATTGDITDIADTDYRGSGTFANRTHVRVSGRFDPVTGQLFLSHQVCQNFSLGLTNSDERNIGASNVENTNAMAFFGAVPASTRVTSTAGVYRDTNTNRPVSFTMYPGLDHEADLSVALPTPGGSVNIESPVLAGGVPSGRGVGDVTLSASTVNINSPVQAQRHFVIPSAAASSVGAVSEVVEINAAISANQHTIVVSDDPVTPVDRSRVVVSASGRLGIRADVLNPNSPVTAANRIYVKASEGDIYIEGITQATEQGYHLVSPVGSETEAPFVLTTNSRLTGVPTGQIVGDIATLTLGNDTLGANYDSIAESQVDLRTDVNRIRFQAGPRGPVGGNLPDPLEEPYPYAINIDEANDLIIDAVASASGPITVTTGGSLDLLAAMKSRGDIVIDSGNAFNVAAPLTTVFGAINVSSSSVTVGSVIRVLDGVQNEERKDITVTASTGTITIADGIYGINGVALEARQGVSGQGRIFGDVVEINSETGSVQARTAANIVYVRAPGQTTIQELDTAIFEIRDSGTVRLAVEGFDTPRDLDNDASTGLNGFEAMSPALLADIYGTSTLAASAPNGSIDILHRSPENLTIVEDSIIGPSGAAGSVTIRSTLAQNISVNDVATASSTATPVRFATDETLDENKVIYQAGDPGVFPTRLTVNVQYDRVTGEIFGFGGIDHMSVRPSDRVLVKNGTTATAGGANNQIRGDIINGVYIVQSLQYENVENDPVKGVVGTATLSMKRSDVFDQTEELSERQYYRVQDGDLRSQVFISNGYVNIEPDVAVNPTPIVVESVPVKAGHVVAEAVAARALSAGFVSWNAATQTVTAVNNGEISFNASLFGDVVLVENNLVVLQEGVVGFDTSAGVYKVIDAGGPGTSWVLQRYQGIDEDGLIAGDPLTTTVEPIIEVAAIVNQGLQRTALTGEMYQVKYKSMHSAELPFQQITDYRDAIEFDVALDPAYDSGNNYRLEIGSDNPAGNVQYTVTTEGGTNTSGGSLGKMITALQKNTALVSRTGLKQEATFAFGSGVNEINLEQALPLIQEPIVLDGNGLSIFGGDISTTRDGATVRTGSLLVDIGPIRPSQAKVARRLVRNVEAFGSLVAVHGFEVGPGSDGIVIRDMTIGGFGSGAAVRVTGTNQVLLENLTIGETRTGQLAPNKYGVLVQNDAGRTGEGTTILRGSIEGSTEAGIRLDTGTDKVRVVNVRVGGNNRSNKVGIAVDSVNGSHMIGVAPILPNQTIAGLPVQVIPDGSGVLANEVLLEKNEASDILEPGTQLFDRVTGRLWEITSKAEEDEINYRFGVSGVDGAALSIADVDALAVEAGFFVQANGRSDTLVLPAGVPVENLYIGQRVSASVAGILPGNTRIAGITEDVTGTTIKLDREISDTAFTAVQFDLAVGSAGLRNNVGFNEDGIVLASGSSRMVRTDVHDSVYDGIIIEGVATSGSHEIGGTFGTTLVQQNNSIYGNQLAGIKFAEGFFAGLGDLAAKEARVNQVEIKGNFLSTTIFSGAGRTNGIGAVSNIVFEDADIQSSYVDSTDRTTETIDDVEVSRYTAKYRPEDDPTNAAFAEIGARDLEGNFHYAGTAAVIDDSIGGGFTGGGSGGTGGDGTGDDDSGRIPGSR